MSKKKNVKKAPREMTHRQLSHHKRQLRRQRIFFYGGIAIIVAVVAIIVGGWLAGEYMPLHATVLEFLETKYDTAYYIDTMVLLSKLYGSYSMSEIANVAVNQIMSGELLILEAEKLGVTVSDEEAKQLWTDYGLDIDYTDAAINLAKSEILRTKLQEEYFSSLVPEADVHLHALAMMVESDAVARSLREKIIAGENFTVLADQYAVDIASKDVHGDYGWHPVSMFKINFFSTIPVDYLSRVDAKAGDLSQPLSDNASKKLGYWLIRVNERPDQETANVSAVFLGSEDEALSIRAKLEAGEELGPIADELSQYSPSQQTHGELGLFTITDNISDAFNGYVFDLSVETGKWSQPLRDDTFYTEGGAWLVKIVDRDENIPLTTGDRDSLIYKYYSDWSTEIWDQFSSLFVNSLTSELNQWAIERANRQL